MFVETDEERDGLKGHVRHRRVDSDRQRLASVLRCRVCYVVVLRVNQGRTELDPEVQADSFLVRIISSWDGVGD